VLARGKPHRATGWLSGTIGTDILVMDRFPEAALPETVRALLIRAKSLYDAPVVPDLPFLFALKEWSPLTDGEQVTINLDIGLVYRGILRT
jgi:hypothetical protein